MKKLMILSIILLIACSNKESDSSSSTSGQNITGSSAKIYGTWIYESPNSTSTGIRGLAALLKDDGTITILNLYIKPGDNSATTIFRKSIGTFTLEGDLIHLKYSYETCNPVGSETLKAKIDPNNPNRLYVSNLDASVLFTMQRSQSSQSDLMLTMVEDKNCNFISKILGQTRTPASAKSVLSLSKSD